MAEALNVIKIQPAHRPVEFVLPLLLKTKAALACDRNTEDRLSATATATRCYNLNSTLDMGNETHHVHQLLLMSAPELPSSLTQPAVWCTFI